MCLGRLVIGRVEVDDIIVALLRWLCHHPRNRLHHFCGVSHPNLPMHVWHVAGQPRLWVHGTWGIECFENVCQFLQCLLLCLKQLCIRRRWLFVDCFLQISRRIYNCIHVSQLWRA